MTRWVSPRGAEAGPAGLRLVWAVTLAFSLASFSGILVLTHDLAATNAVLNDSVGQVRKINRTTDRGLAANLALPPTDDAVLASMPSVESTVASLRHARTTLATLGTQIRVLADVLASTNGPLVHIVAAAQSADEAARSAQTPTSQTSDTLRYADARTSRLQPELDHTLDTARSIESKLRILLLLPGK